MIRQIRGIVLDHEKDGIVIDVMGFGVLVNLASPERFPEGMEVSLKTFLSIKQDGVDLYGFLDEAERHFFELLLQVSGVGPKTALGVMRRAPRESLEGAIASRDLDYLTRVVGLGKKAAEKLIVELSEKVGGADKVHDDNDGEVFDTLVALGYTDREARVAVSAIPKTITGKDARLKAALSSSR